MCYKMEHPYSCSEDSNNYKPSWNSSYGETKYFSSKSFVLNTSNPYEESEVNGDSCKSFRISWAEPPVEIHEECTTDIDLPVLVWHGYDIVPKLLSVCNTGRTITVNGQWTNGRPYIEGGPLNGKYMFSQIHFHCPSEHEIDGRRYPLEMHVVHYKTSYLTQERAMHEKDGTLVLVYLFQVVECERTVLSEITDLNNCLEETNCRLEIRKIPLCELVKPFFCNYYVYWGSVMVKNSSYILQWIINCDQLQVAKQEVDTLLSVMSTCTAMTTKGPKMKPQNSIIYRVGEDYTVSPPTADIETNTSTHYQVVMEPEPANVQVTTCRYTTPCAQHQQHLRCSCTAHSVCCSTNAVPATCSTNPDECRCSRTPVDSNTTAAQSQQTDPWQNVNVCCTCGGFEFEITLPKHPCKCKQKIRRVCSSCGGSKSGISWCKRKWNACKSKCSVWTKTSSRSSTDTSCKKCIRKKKKCKKIRCAKKPSYSSCSDGLSDADSFPSDGLCETVRTEKTVVVEVCPPEGQCEVVSTEEKSVEEVCVPEEPVTVCTVPKSKVSINDTPCEEPVDDPCADPCAVPCAVPCKISCSTTESCTPCSTSLTSICNLRSYRKKKKKKEKCKKQCAKGSLTSMKKRIKRVVKVKNSKSDCDDENSVTVEIKKEKKRSSSKSGKSKHSLKSSKSKCRKKTIETCETNTGKDSNGECKDEVTTLFVKMPENTFPPGNISSFSYSDIGLDDKKDREVEEPKGEAKQPQYVINNVTTTGLKMPDDKKTSKSNELCFQMKHFFQSEKSDSMNLSQGYQVSIVCDRNVLQEYRGMFQPQELSLGSFEKLKLVPKYQEPDDLQVRLEECIVKKQSLDNFCIDSKFLLKGWNTSDTLTGVSKEPNESSSEKMLNLINAQTQYSNAPLPDLNCQSVQTDESFIPFKDKVKRILCKKLDVKCQNVQTEPQNDEQKTANSKDLIRCKTRILKTTSEPEFSAVSKKQRQDQFINLMEAKLCKSANPNADEILEKGKLECKIKLVKNSKKSMEISDTGSSSQSISKKDTEKNDLEVTKRNTVYFMYDKIEKDPLTGKKIFMGRFRTKEDLRILKDHKITSKTDSSNSFGFPRISDKTSSVESRLLAVEKLKDVPEKKISHPETQKRPSENEVKIHKFDPKCLHLTQFKTQYSSPIIADVVKWFQEDGTNVGLLADIIGTDNKQKPEIRVRPGTTKSNCSTNDKTTVGNSSSTNPTYQDKATMCSSHFITHESDENVENSLRIRNPGSDAVIVVPVEVDSWSKIEVVLIEHSDDKKTIKSSQKYIPLV